MSKLTSFKNWIAKWIATIGQNPDFGYFFAHAGAAHYYATRFPRGYARVFASLAAAAVTGYKEIIFDPAHEINPPQKIWPDGAKDLFGYWTGLFVAQFDK